MIADTAVRPSLKSTVRRTIRERAFPALLIASLIAVAVGAAISMMGSNGSVTAVAAPTHSTTPAATTTLFVHVSGAVQQPGLVTVTVGARVVDAIAAAGGFVADADQAAVNLARAVKDGEQILVPVIGAVASSGTGQATGQGQSGGLINLNTADQAALETLPHVGPALAKRIIAWREEHGGFSAVDDLRSVSGIGEKTFADIEALVTV